MGERQQKKNKKDAFTPFVFLKIKTAETTKKS